MIGCRNKYRSRKDAKPIVDMNQTAPKFDLGVNGLKIHQLSPYFKCSNSMLSA